MKSVLHLPIAKIVIFFFFFFFFTQQCQIAYSKGNSGKNSTAQMVCFTAPTLFHGPCPDTFSPFRFSQNFLKGETFKFEEQVREAVEFFSIQDQPYFMKKKLINCQKDGRRSCIVMVNANN